MERRPEILAPAGDAHSLAAALASGADAVYFGLDEGFNARARAQNFPLATLPETVATIHRHGARAYLTMNTLVFEPELDHVRALLPAIAAAGVDALIVQDPAIAVLARAICPQLDVHASTQMTICNVDAAAFARSLGIVRVVLPREFSVDDIRSFVAGADVETEVFVHGALCVSWSGQCLTSEAWGGRSANRGQCAQSCRMPYDLVVDGAPRDLGDVRYLLSPKDQAAYRAVPELVALGVHSLKIEGRQKGPQYVATAVHGYRNRVLAAIGDPSAAAADPAVELRAMALSYTRGFSDGFFGGSDHQRLVEGRFPKHRGVSVGRVAAVDLDARSVVVAPSASVAAGPGAGAGDGDVDVTRIAVTLRPGMGVVFDQGRPEEDEPGGPVFTVAAAPRGRFGAGAIELGFGRPGPDLRRVQVGDRVFATSDPALQAFVPRVDGGADAEGRIEIALAVTGALGTPLQVEATIASGPSKGRVVAASTPATLVAARGAGIDAELLAEKFAFGGTPFTPVSISVDGLAPGLHVPVAELKTCRRALTTALLAIVERGAPRRIDASPTLHLSTITPAPAREPFVVPLVRTDEQLDAALAAGVEEIELDWMELSGLTRAVERTRAAGVVATVATLRVTKPGEAAFDDRIARCGPNGILIRHLGALVRFAADPESAACTRHGDFSLNVTNHVTAATLLAHGLATVTASFDLDEAQLLALVDATPAGRIAIAIHHRMPAFHTEHCVYAHLLSDGRDYRTCGRPCERHRVSLRDHLGHEHPVIVDAGCRNTVFDAGALTSALVVPELTRRGVRRFRVEFVRETAAECTAILAAYRDLVAGRTTPRAVLAALPVEARVGVARGGMAVQR